MTGCLTALKFEVTMDFPAATYDPYLKLQWQHSNPQSHMIAFWALGNQVIFMAVFSILQSCKHQLGKIDSFNNCSICLTITAVT